MNKGWNTVSWILIVGVQIAVGYGLVFLANIYMNQPQIQTISQFLLVPLSIWLGYIIGVYGIGMLGLSWKKVEPRVPALRVLTTAVVALIPMLMLVFNAVTVGTENLQQFHDLVMVRMVPYYTQLCAVFALLGFYITMWWHRAVPNKNNSKGAIKNSGKSKK